MSPTDWEPAAARLGSDSPGARRVAILDLIRSSDPRTAAAFLSRLPRETDERAALLMIRHLGAHAGPEAMPVLRSLYNEPRTPVAIAHAAITEHDRIAARTA